MPPSAMLIFVGFKLAHPKEFKHVWHVEKDQFTIFIVTIFLTLATDLLIGVLSGIALEIIVNFFHGAKLRALFLPKEVKLLLPMIWFF